MRGSRLFGSRRAVSAVEFALIAPAMLMMGLGTLEYGRLAWTQQALQATASSGARCMAVLDSPCATGGAYSSSLATSYVVSEAKGWQVTVVAANVAVDRAASCGGVANFSTVAITYKFETVLPLIITSLTNGINLKITSCYPNTH